MRALSLLALPALFAVFACQASESAHSPMGTQPTDVTSLAAPVAKIDPVQLEQHGHVRTDDYFWLKERESPEVIGYLEAENAYTAASMAHTGELQATLFTEIKGRIKQDDESVPYALDGYYYYTCYKEGQDYPIYCRKKGSLDADDEILVDTNELARDQSYCSVGSRAISSDSNRMVYGLDTVGRRFYTLHVKDLATGELLDDVIPDVTTNVAWANDNKTFFYTKQHPETLRSYQVWRHRVGQAQDELVYEEKDETFRCFVFKTKSKRYLMIGSTQTLSAEYRYLDADNPEGEFALFAARERGHEYRLDHFGEHFYIRTNDAAKNFRLMRTPVTVTARGAWEEIVAGRDDVLLQGFDVFAGHLVLTERELGLVKFRVLPWSEVGTEAGGYTIDFGEPTYRVSARSNVNFDTTLLRYSYSSMTTPNSVFDFDMQTRGKALLKRDEVLGDFDPANYRTERLFATARDGAQVPISLVQRVDVKRDGSNPVHLSAYGSYGSSRDASFSAARLSLLDRGFVCAIAHVRGGSELGRSWYEGGKLFNKKNTFTDFIDCAQHLVSEDYTTPDKLFASGGSAGGLLIGAVANMEPELFEGLVARVPFVDVVTTMLDDSIPLTTSEYDEWGDPNDRKYYDYMLSYSPYDQVEAKQYPNMLVTTGLHDSQVQYWEPAKWVAKLRAKKTDGNRLLLKTNMTAGHGGASGRDARYKETAFMYAFMIDLAERTAMP